MQAEQAPTPSSADPLTSRVIDGRYRVGRRIGAGGMGEVFVARQLHIDRAVALKVLPRRRADDARARAQFVTETKAISQLTSPHTVTLYDAGHMENGAPYLAMELLEGLTLRARLAEAPLELEAIVRIVDGIALSLAEAHARGIVHLDIKPSNVFLSRTPEHADQVKVLDFGLARLISSVELSDHAAGTLRYMAPETLSGGQVDARTDVYALAMVAYELLAMAHPFGDLQRDALIDAQLSQQPVALDQRSDHELPPELPRLLARALAKPARLRPADASVFRRAWRAAFGLSDELLSSRISGPAAADGSDSAPQFPASETVLSVELPQQPSTPPRRTAGRISGRRSGVLAGGLLLALMAAGIYQGSRSLTVEPGAADVAGSMPTNESSAAAVVEIAVQSTPAGATVTLDGVVRGQTPLSLAVAKGRAASRLTVSMSGYEPHHEVLDAQRDTTIVVQLPAMAIEREPTSPLASSKQRIADSATTPRAAATAGRPSPVTAASTEPHVADSAERDRQPNSQPDSVRERVRDYLD